jgi:hypothetical protein
MSIYPKTEKAKIKAISLTPDQLKRLGKFIDLDQYGDFSRFAQEALDEKMDRLETNIPLENKIAS